MKGSVVLEGDTATLTFRRVLRHTPEHVWDALSTPEGLAQWLLATNIQIDGRTGGSIEMVSGAAHYHSTGAILRWDPPRVLEYEWNVAPVPEMPLGQRAVFRYELQPEGDATLLLVTYRRITRDTARGFLPGLHALLDRLEAQLNGSPLPDWMTRFTEVRGDYPEWNDHAPAPAQ